MLQIGYSLREKRFYQETLNFVEKTLFFAFIKLECVNEYLKYVKIMFDSGIRTHHLWDSHRVDTRHMYYARHQRLCRHEKSARHGQFQKKEKKTPTTGLEFFFEKFFQRKIKMDARGSTK